MEIILLHNTFFFAAAEPTSAPLWDCEDIPVVRRLF